MKDSGQARRVFQMHETERLHALQGRPLATFLQRVGGYLVDVVFAVLIWGPAEFLWRRYVLHQSQIDMKWDFHELGNVLVMLLYWASFNYFGNGRTLGQARGGDAGSVVDRGSNGTVAIDRAIAGIWRGNS